MTRLCKSSGILFVVGVLLLVIGTITASDGISCISRHDATNIFSGGGCCPDGYQPNKEHSHTTFCDTSEKKCTEWDVDVCNSKTEQEALKDSRNQPWTEKICITSPGKCCRIRNYGQCATTYSCGPDIYGTKCLKPDTGSAVNAYRSASSQPMS